MLYDERIELNKDNKFIAMELKTTYLEKYQVEMIRQNSLDGIIPITSRIINDTEEILYNISSVTPLSKEINKVNISYYDFAYFLKRVVEILNNSFMYLLNINNFQLNINSIYINQEKGLMEPMLIYLPINKDYLPYKESLNNLIDSLLPYINKKNEKILKLIHKLKLVDAIEYRYLDELLSIINLNNEKKIFSIKNNIEE